MFQTIVFLHIAIFSYLNIVLKKRFFFRQICGVHPLQQTITFPPGRCRKRSFKPFPLPLPLPFPPWHQCQYKNNMPERRRERREGEAGKILFSPPPPPPPYERNEAGHPPPLFPFFLPSPTDSSKAKHTHTLEGGGFDGGREQQRRRRLHPALPWFFLCPARLVGHGGIPPRKGGRGRS